MFEFLAVMAGPGPHSSGDKNLLIVDDELDIRESLIALFMAEIPGVNVYAAASGREALAILKKHRIDLVISDYKMPGMNGLELLSEIATSFPATKRALITAFYDSLMVVGEDSPQLEFFMAKPINVDMIVTHTQRTLGLT